METDNKDSPALYVVRNEVDDDCEFHCDAVASRFPTAKEIAYPEGERVPLDDADGVVLTGSTAGVYEAEDRPWIAHQQALVRELVDRRVPTLGICFGHQIANAAFGSTVEHVGTKAAPVEATLAEDPLFDGIEPVVVSLHGDVVTEPGDEMEIIASAKHARVFGTCHRDAPLWTVQFHPELTAAHRELLVEKFGWESGEYSFDDVDSDQLFANFERLVRESVDEPDRSAELPG